MKRKKCSYLFFTAILFIISIGIVSAQLLYAACCTISSGGTFSTGVLNASYDDAYVELEPESFTTSNARKTLLSINVKVNGSYVAAVAETKSLGFACYTYVYEDIGSGTWKASLKQANATGSILYAGVTTNFEVGSN